MKAAFTLVEIMIVVALVGILAMIAVPAFMRAIDQAREEACIANQRALVQARNEWALETRRAGNAIPTAEDLDGYVKGGIEKCFCPLDPNESFETSYRFNDFDDTVMCLMTPQHDEDSQW